MIVLTAGLLLCAAFQVGIMSCQSRILGQQTVILDRTIEMSRNDQRAWVGPLKASLPDIKKGSTAPITVTIRNSGKSPALGLEFAGSCVAQPSDKPFAPTYGPSREPLPASRAVLPPDTELTVPLCTPAPLTEEEVKGIIESGKTAVYAYGKITYKDVFRRPHHTTFAYLLNPSHSGWRALNAYNEMD